MAHAVPMCRVGRQRGGEEQVMMGRKERPFAPLEHLTLEDLVPPDHFYRHREQMRALSFVRDLVAPC